MSHNINVYRLIIILLFALTFTTVGWAAPVIYASNVPADQVIEVHEFEATDTTTESARHYVCFDRTVSNGMSADVFTELYLIPDNGDRIEIQSTNMDRYFQEGRSNVITPFELPENMVAGEYRYIVIAEMSMADGRVIRDFVFESKPFTVTEGEPVTQTRPIEC